ncbi:Multifunctional conjugation protein TraI [Crateriforma conspicua]|uniref:Multifunctional conjugation protein TraI n=1 Tax=Crateriforma conspicua TaxID=2527996 RepID=A0A5C6FJP3_9PLAN|nr:MobF family relaxase [Crateriforma conspicua]TWU62350.1 Multifunctional conjugation protein TraI [Crateriforma conspicua]
MLSYKLIGSTGQEVGYYAELGQEDYYVGGGEPPGQWWGSGAKYLGLSGKVTGKDLAAILAGFQPGGSKLVQNAGDKRRRAGFDLTWSVPKSVSVALSQADEALGRRIEQAASQAVSTVMETVEEFCGRSRRGQRGERVEKSGLVAAIFRHDTARGLPGEVPDPNLHFHAVVANVSVREDGSTGTLDARALFSPQMKMALGALFRVELSRNLDRLGLASHCPTDDRGRAKVWFELNAIPSELIKEFSKRRSQIERWLRQRGQSGAKAAEKAATATRRKKDRYTRYHLQKAWTAIGRKFGVTAETIRAACRQTRPQQVGVADAEAAVTAAVELITSDRSRFSEIELLRFAAQEAQATGLSIRDVRSAVRRQLSNTKRVVRLKSVDGIEQFTTHEMIAVERRLVKTAESLSADWTVPVSNRQVDDAVKRYPTLRDEQVAAIRHLVSGTGQVACVNGMAGTGKTFMLSVAREAWEAAGLHLVGTALAAKASQTIQDEASIDSTHLHRLLFEIDTGKRTLNSKSIVVLDEAAMVGTRMMARLLDAVDRAGAKVAMIGDHRQLQAIAAGAPFRVLSEQLGVAELRQISRQRESWSRQVVTDLADGNADTALKQLHEHGDLFIGVDRDDAIGRLVDDWFVEFEKGSDARIFAGTRLETATLNRLCQTKRRLAGNLGEACILVGSDEFRVGDRVVITRNDRVGILKNGMTGEVTSVDTRNATLKVGFDSGVNLHVDTRAFDHVQLGYCTTTHKGQGQTVDSAFVLVGGVLTDRELSYVQGSRARGRTRFYSDVESGGATIEALADQMNRSRQKDMALEHVIEAA